MKKVNPSYEELEQELSNLRKEIKLLKENNNFKKNKQTELLLKSCIESPKDIIILSIDLNYKYLYFNTAHKASMKYAYNKTVAVGMNLLNCITSKEDREKAKLNYDRALVGESHSTIAVFGEKNKSYYESFYNPIINEKNEIIGATAIAKNITDRILIEEKLKAITTRNEAILDSVPDIIMETDNNKVYTWTNQAGINFFGDDVIGKEAAFYFEGEQNTYEIVQPLFDGSQKITCVESLQRRKDGEKRLLSWWCRALRDENEKITGTLALAYDITEQKKAEKLLIESEEKFRNLTEFLPSAIYETDLNGNYTYVNQNGFESTGYTKKDIEKGLNIKDLIIPEQRNRAFENLKKILNGKNIGLNEYILRKKNGKFFPVYGKTMVIYKDNKPIGFRGIIIDISEKKEAEIKLSESESHYREIFENANDIIYTLDLEGNFTSVNSITEKMLGFKFSDFKKPNIKDFITPESYKIAIENISLKIQGKKHSSVYEAECISKSGKMINLEINSFLRKKDEKPFEIFGIARDITERKKAEKEIIESEQRYRELANSLPICVFETNLNGNVIFGNNVAIDWFGYSKEELSTELNVIQFIEEKNRPKALENFTQILTNRLSSSNEYVAKRKDGSTFPVLISSHVILKNDKVTGIRGIVIDYTNTKNAETQLIKAKEKAEDSDNLKSTFLQNISHEIRTPMNAIVGFANLLNQPELTFEKQKNYIEIINNSSKQLLSIINDILTISNIENKRDAINIKLISINSTIDELLTIYKSKNTNQQVAIIAKLSLPDKNDQIYTDKTKLSQILSNLLNNALKFTHEGFIEFGYEYKNEFLEFYVKDTGIGIKPELHEIIFERFRQADSYIQTNYGGTGLGLSISKTHTELLGGTMWVKSEYGKGSTFFFTIPYIMSDNQVFQKSKNINITSAQCNKDQTILIAEDEEYNYLFVVELLNTLKVKIIHATNGLEAVEICHQHPEIELVLMDIKMPIMDGFEAITQIKKFRPDLPVIANSAYVLPNEKKKANEYGFSAYLEKPIDRNIFFELINKFLKK